VGGAFARRLARASASVLGFVGRDAERAERAAASVGVGVALGWADLKRADCVVFAVGDEQLPGAVAAAVAPGEERSGLWVHTSGRHDLKVLAPARSLGVQVGSLHPLAPFPGSVDVEPVAGTPALVQCAPESVAQLRELCRMMQFEPIVCERQNRGLYHAACALAANGATVLFGLAAELLGRAGGLSEAEAGRVVESLMRAAVLGAQRHGAGAALSGPVRRGDDATIGLHLRELGEHAPHVTPAYRALMTRAISLAADEGLAPADRLRLERLLGEVAGDDQPGQGSCG